MGGGRLPAAPCAPRPKHVLALLCVLLMSSWHVVARYVMGFIKSTKELNAQLTPFYRLSPGFCLGHGLWALALNDLLSSFGGSGVGISAPDPLSDEVAGDDVRALFLAAPCWFLLTVLVDVALTYPALTGRVVRLLRPGLRAVVDAPFDVDEDVAAEARRIGADPAAAAERNIICLSELRKVYKGVLSAKQTSFVAVKGVSLGIARGECFGYVGMNGAGSSSAPPSSSAQTVPFCPSA